MTSHRHGILQDSTGQRWGLVSLAKLAAAFRRGEILACLSELSNIDRWAAEFWFTMICEPLMPRRMFSSELYSFSKSRKGPVAVPYRGQRRGFDASVNALGASRLTHGLQSHLWYSAVPSIYWCGLESRDGSARFLPTSWAAWSRRPGSHDPARLSNATCNLHVAFAPHNRLNSFRRLCFQADPNSAVSATVHEVRTEPSSFFTTVRKPWNQAWNPGTCYSFLGLQVVFGDHSVKGRLLECQTNDVEGADAPMRLSVSE